MKSKLNFTSPYNKNRSWIFLLLGDIGIGRKKTSRNPTAPYYIYILHVYIHLHITSLTTLRGAKLQKKGIWGEAPFIHASHP